MNQQQVTHRTTDLEQEVNYLKAEVRSLQADVRRLLNPEIDRGWMSIPEAAEHTDLKGRLSAKQLRCRVISSIEDPVTAVFIANLHYQIVPIPGSDRHKYIVNVAAIASWLSDSTKSKLAS
jgi:hypothetical protein